MSRTVRSNTVSIWKTAVIISNGNGEYFLNEEALRSKLYVNMEHFMIILILRKTLFIFSFLSYSACDYNPTRTNSLSF